MIPLSGLRMGLLGSFVLVVHGLLAPSARAANNESPPTFERHIRPIFKAYCLDCHGGEAEIKGQLDLRLRRFIARGGESGPAIVPGQASESLLMHRLTSGEMPPGEKKLSPTEIALVERWIAAGAPVAREEPEMLDPGSVITPEEREFWSFQPIGRPALTLDTPDRERLRTPIDSLIATHHAEFGLRFSAEADARTLLRRTWFSMAGLPPDFESAEEFVADERPDAYERMLDRALASPQYGERWGRHWLDVAGYADSNGGHTSDSNRPYAYKYRDYVIRSFNSGKPLDQFLIEQLAGDELVPPPHANLPPEAQELLIATGFLRMAADGTGDGVPDPNGARQQVVADTLKIVSSALLGMTVHCAQCHDHRYDPIPAEDYYRLRAVFEPALDPQNWRPPGQRLISLFTDEDRQRAAAVEAEVAKVAAEKQEKQTKFLADALEQELQKHPEPQRESLRAAYQTPAAQRTPEQTKLLADHPSVNITPGVLYQYNAAAAEELKKLDGQIASLRATKPVEDFISVLNEIPGKIPVTHVFHRGDYRQPKSPVAPGDLTIAAPPGQRFELPTTPPTADHSSGRRLAYARYLTRGDHPLLNRVLANRVWMHIFGRGIVGTPSDFGALGDRPTDLQLLDWLASELPRRNWDLKAFQRLLLTSTAFRQVAVRHEPFDKLDADNRYLWRMPLRRLDAEEIRDRILWVAGGLSTRMFGPMVPIKEDEVGQIVVNGSDDRRSIYLQARRTQPVSLLTVFDAPVMETNCERRTNSTVATQSLVMMNSEFVVKQAEQIAQRARSEAGSAAAPESAGEFASLLFGPARRAWELALGRRPSETELQLANDFFTHQAAELRLVEPNLAAPDFELRLLSNLCQSLLCSNEFLYVD